MEVHSGTVSGEGPQLTQSTLVIDIIRSLSLLSVSFPHPFHHLGVWYFNFKVWLLE